MLAWLQVKEVSENPLAGMAHHRAGSSSAASAALRGDKALETQVLESSLHKICSLLSVREVQLSLQLHCQTTAC